MQKPNYKITIHPQKRGFNVHIGCESLCYGDSENEMEEMMTDILLYFDDPEKVREKYSVSMPQKLHGTIKAINCAPPSPKEAQILK